MNRAIRFYETVFNLKLDHQLLGPLEMAWFPWVENGMGSGGSLVFSEKNYKPSPDGVLIYLSSQSGDIEEELRTVEKEGGKVLMPKTQISPEIGYMGLFLDTEGNRIAIHAHR
jgi:predicted enzyme related to lactoylglutathione lyase